MPPQLASIIAGVGVLLALVQPAAADNSTLDNPTRSEREPPSLLGYGFAGLGAGALVGVAGGYLAGRDPHWHWHRADYRKLGLGVGIGALSGMAFGLGLGGVDLGANEPGFGGVVLRDMLYGTGLGALAGLLGGGISAIAQHDSEHALFGTAIGAVAGAGVGLILGFVEAPRAIRERKEEDQERKQQHTVAPSVSATRDAGQQLVWMVGSAGRF